MSSAGRSTVESRAPAAGWGLALVALAAALWGADGVFRRGLALELPPGTVVFWEHMILVAITAGTVWRSLPALRKLGSKEWASLLLIGIGASATATALFTAAFRFGDPTTPLLLQKLQPIFAIVGAWVLLSERLRPRFWTFAALAFGAGWLITFADPFAVSVSSAAAGGLAIGAAALWGMGTVLGRHVSAHLEPSQVTALRFAIGLPASAVIVLITEGSGGFAVSGGDAFPLLLLALIPGLAAISIYYRGLKTTPASLATLGELAFPLSAISLNFMFFGTTITATQWVGVIALAAILITMSRTARERGPRSLGVASPERSGVGS